MTLYSVLGVREDATESSIKAAYRTAAKANHPDTNPHATPGLFAQIAEAYDVLGDKAKRVSYDYTLSLERSTVDTMQKSEWSGFETYTNKASGAKDKHHGRYHESDMKWRERTGREMAEDASAAAAWWRREKAQSKQKAKRALLTLKAKEKQMRRGVVYLGAIPPRMKPQKLRLLLTPFGKLDRIYLTPEDPSLRLKRKKFGGNTVRIGPFPNPITVYCPYVTVYCLLHTSRVDCSARLLRLFAHTHCEVHPYSRL